MSNALLKNTLTIILAGGQGERLYPLTRDRAKPAVPFGGMYRIVDFTLSNCLNSEVPKIYVLTQYKSFSLDRHINLGWSSFFNNPELDRFIHSSGRRKCALEHPGIWERLTRFIRTFIISNASALNEC